MSESFAELFEESLKTVDMESGSIITGVVVDIDNEWVTVHAGLKSEGVIPREQFVNESGELEVAVGDTVQVSMDAVDDGAENIAIGYQAMKTLMSVLRILP